MVMKKALLPLLIALLLSTPAMVVEDDFCARPVDTVYGKVKGECAGDTNTCVWRGIPYAAPPVGDLRWKPPQPHERWDGVRDALKFGDRCMQKGIMALENLQGGEKMSEDCLYLNVWRPKKKGKFPVMVWIHGGGYYGGSGSSPMYWGDRLAGAGDVVVVTINYRLNIFGFLGLPALADEDSNRSAGEYGSLDQVAALQWVHDNISNFGGDPDNVTIFGESAGGFSVCVMLATPLAKGLFHRAVMHSGGCESLTMEEDKAFTIGADSAQKLKCDPSDLDCLRKIPAKKLLKKGSGGMMEGMEFVPMRDGYVIDGTPLSMIRNGNYNKAPFMAGSNRDEFAKALKLIRKVKKVKPGNYEHKLVEIFNMDEEEAKRLVELYPLEQYGNRPVEAYGRMFGADMALACPTYHGLLAAAQQQKNAFYYRFDYDDMKYGKYLGAAHSLEIPFVFNSLDRPPDNILYNKKNMAPARELSRVMQGYWLNFARTGDPNGGELPDWPEFWPESQMVNVFDDPSGGGVRSQPAGIADRCAFWETYTKEHPNYFDKLQELR